ncbi:MAG: anthranilate phosphoribosyltransferase [Bacteroidales bacterium]|jgi:anthranilate phosphoribosyltransferase
MKEILTHLFDKNVLTKQEAKEVLLNIGRGKFTDPEIAAFLTVYMMRKIHPDELSGFREALLDLCVPVDLDGFNTIDVCGTGGDEKNTFNISTLCAFVLAGTGAKVVKHGNYGVSSGCGSSNILEYMSYTFSNDNAKIRKELEEANISYLHAPVFHPSMKYVGPVRKSLKLKTFFNLLGPMVNPAKPVNQIVGVYNEEALDLYHNVFSSAGINSIILYSLDGYDEISLTGDFRSVSSGEDKIYSPESIGFGKVFPEDLFGGNSVEEAAKIFLDILEGNGTRPQNDVVTANAGFALKCYFPERSLQECIHIARESLENRKALKAMKKLIALQ